MQIIPLSEGSFTIDKTKVFVPFDTSTEILNHRPMGSLLVEIQPFVIVTEKDVILLDTGLGYRDKQGNAQLHANLYRAGVNPTQVTKVLMSHLHKDHAGGVTVTGQQQDERFISFPYATYYVQRREFEHALDYLLYQFLEDKLFNTNNINSKNTNQFDKDLLNDLNQLKLEHKNLVNFLSDKNFSENEIDNIFNVLTKNEYCSLNKRYIGINQVEFYNFCNKFRFATYIPTTIFDRSTYNGRRVQNLILLSSASKRVRVFDKIDRKRRKSVRFCLKCRQLPSVG